MEIEKDKFNRVVHRLIDLAKEREHTILQSEIDDAWSSIEYDADIALGLRKRRKTMSLFRNPKLRTRQETSLTTLWSQ